MLWVISVRKCGVVLYSVTSVCLSVSVSVCTFWARPLPGNFICESDLDILKMYLHKNEVSWSKLSPKTSILSYIMVVFVAISILLDLLLSPFYFQILW